ncbi:hypothetical protein BC937DRAFT_86900 [Endogone sp. FLAS-F59071]|nr:hypothetical protein BC937DRAFT_86900 [Endogone sp. FLAS-F59071]|eukprot:RUS19797.1 hypothetical protein BC937DRAFT_86900 [Endogone sp. FLAS-F59071]
MAGGRLFISSTRDCKTSRWLACSFNLLRARMITTYCVELAQSQTSRCGTCKKIIPNRSLRCGKVERKDKKEKKDQAKYTWYHFRCFQVPELLTRIPIEQFRGYPKLSEKDKQRVQKLLSLGLGGTLPPITSKHGKKALTAEKVDQNGDSLPQIAGKHVKKASTAKTAGGDGDGPKTKGSDEDDKDVDMTGGLTAMSTKHVKEKKPKNPLGVKTADARVSKKAAMVAERKQAARKGLDAGARVEMEELSRAARAIQESREKGKAVLKKLKKKMNR